MRTPFILAAAAATLMTGCGLGTRYVHEEVVVDVEHHDQAYHDGATYDVHHASSVAHHGYSGYTECGDFFAPDGDVNTCQPGSFCTNPTFSTCSPGCLSDQNCSGEQLCVKDAGRNRGTCQAM
jgi:hypothetical protein